MSGTFQPSQRTFPIVDFNMTITHKAEQVPLMLRFDKHLYFPVALNFKYLFIISRFLY